MPRASLYEAPPPIALGKRNRQRLAAPPAVLNADWIFGDQPSRAEQKFE